MVGPGRVAGSCASPGSITGQRGTSLGRRGEHAVDVTGLGGCPRLRSCCRKAARERLLLMGELMAAGDTGHLGRWTLGRARLFKRRRELQGPDIRRKRGKAEPQVRREGQKGDREPSGPGARMLHAAPRCSFRERMPTERWPPGLEERSGEMAVSCKKEDGREFACWF